jgi:hypothetical protein
LGKRVKACSRGCLWPSFSFTRQNAGRRFLPSLVEGGWPHIALAFDQLFFSTSEHFFEIAKNPLKIGLGPNKPEFIFSS